MSYGASAGAVCCCNCGAQSCCCPCLYVPYTYTATGSLDYRYFSSSCDSPYYSQASGSFDLLVSTADGSYTLEINSFTIPNPTHTAKHPPFNPYSNNNITGQTTITGDGEFSSFSSGFGPEGGSIEEETNYTVTWRQTSTNFIDPDGCPPLSECTAFTWVKKEDNDCDDPNVCQLIIEHGRGLLAASDRITVQFKQTRVGQSVLREYDSAGELVGTITTDINEEEYFNFPWGHVLRIIGDYGDCEDLLGEHRMVESGAPRILDLMEIAIRGANSSGALETLTDECDGGVTPQELQTQTAERTYSSIYNPGCASSTLYSLERVFNSRATVNCTLDKANITGEPTCP